jgi:hypothetical protein
VGGPGAGQCALLGIAGGVERDGRHFIVATTLRQVAQMRRRSGGLAIRSWSATKKAPRRGVRAGLKARHCVGNERSRAAQTRPGPIVPLLIVKKGGKPKRMGKSADWRQSPRAGGSTRGERAHPLRRFDGTRQAMRWTHPSAAPQNKKGHLEGRP